ncbi:Predicted nuclease of the RNAse H fold, HicB family [Natronoarchaeum philippinense]|uniref:Predicted nuclease of the RNAse H fold, HicB family n=1 Tax=Natronoarchaeum philippinense TaxID=558529 RepID=A0A285P9E1_NATPI|nr:type II toxin-antitoxin system HicB family antitoxin [Natronoarchaeum philippinense]SNZ18344.1 Predicted nuclease of the RNAse H fold, HicB family [Natronoarchaeum philippinense]
MGVQSRDGPNSDTITVTHEERWYVAKDEETGIASQGKTKIEALQNLAEALELTAETTADEEDLEPSSAPWFSS